MTATSLRRALLALTGLFCLGSSVAAQFPVRPAGPRALRPSGSLLVSGFGSDAIHVYDAATGTAQGVIAPVPGAQSIRSGPDGMLYVCAEASNEILRLDPESLTLTGAFVADDPKTPEDENGPLDGPTGAVFGPDGNLYVASFETDAVLRYDGTTGLFLDVFVSSGAGGLNGPDAGMTFGPDGNLYVPSFWNSRVIRYDGTTGALIDLFIVQAPGSPRQPRDLAFVDGLLYVTGSDNNRIVRYDLDGNFVDRFLNTSEPYGMAFHPVSGEIWVVGPSPNDVRLFDGASGDFLRTVVDPGAGGVVSAVFVAYVP